MKKQDGKYYQQCEVVMLATNYGKLTLYDYKDLKTLSYALGNHKGSTNLIPQHLYITSNEEIKIKATLLNGDIKIFGSASEAGRELFNDDSKGKQIRQSINRNSSNYQQIKFENYESNN